jgi:hypothetical protein
MGNRELSHLSLTAIESNGWIRESLCNRLVYYSKYGDSNDTTRR